MKRDLLENNNCEARHSNFELLRLISMFFIVLYHFLRWFVQDNPSHHVLQALWLPLHVGVVCFVLISGYFRIKPSSSGFIKIIAMVLIYSLPEIITGMMNANDWHDVMHSFMFISRTNYWYVRTYIGLYLCSPLINAFLDHSSIKAKWYMLIVSGIISVYLGNFSRYHLYVDGTNLVNFLFLYQLGQMLSLYSEQWRKIKVWKLLMVWVLINVMLVVGFYYSIDTHVGELLWRLSFPYNSPVLIINAVFLFIIIGHLSFTSSVLNNMSAGVFAVYLIHGNHPLVTGFQRKIVSAIFPYTSNYVSFVGVLILMTLVVMLLCLLINQLLSPVWKLSRHLGNMTYRKFGF